MKVWMQNGVIAISMAFLSSCATPLTATHVPTYTDLPPVGEEDVTLSGETNTVEGIETPVYQLYEPNSEEFLVAIPPIVQQMERLDTDEYQPDSRALQQVVNDEFWARYADDLDTVSLDVLYEAEPYVRAYYKTPDYLPGWHEQALYTWLRDRQPDLTVRDTWEFQGYELHVESVDFNGDGIDELAAQLDFHAWDEDDEYPTIVFYFLMRQDTTQPEGYIIFDNTVIWDDYNNNVESVDAIDITGDGLPEWLISTAGCSGGVCGATLHMFSWHGNALTPFSVGEQPQVYPMWPRVPPGTWSFENMDDDAALEIVQRQTFDLNCEFSTMRIFNWDEERKSFIGGETTYEYPETAWCTMRFAHEAMRDLDFASAVEHYEHMLSSDAEEDREAWQYAHIRLSAAYALNGQTDQAVALLAELAEEQPTSSLMKEMIVAANASFSRGHNALNLCAALYDTLGNYNIWSASSDTDIWRFGQINDLQQAAAYGGGDFSPANTGCNITGLWSQATKLLNDNLPLDTQLEALGWQIEGQLTADMNNDGIDEWLAWSSQLPGEAMLRWSDGSAFHYGVIYGGFPTEPTSYGTTLLPDDAGVGLVVLWYDPAFPCNVDLFEGRGFIQVLSLDQDVLQQIAYQQICSLQTIEEAFPDIHELHVLSNHWGDLEILYWDSEEGMYILPDEGNTDSETPLQKDQLSCYSGNYGFCGNRDSPTEALQMIDEVLVQPPDDATIDFTLAFRYLRASLLEELGRSDEALAEYVAIHDVGLESPWGPLAGLHLRSED
jgi:tetratricopeptide (TPR) repeat protein